MQRVTWAAVVLLLLAPVRVRAETARIHGTVLAVTPKAGEAIVRHDAFGGMPSMVMPFRIVPRKRVAELLPGSEIEATVDTATDPWTLRDVTTDATRQLAPPAAQRIVPLHVGDLVPDTPFVDQNGRPFRFSMLRGQDAVLSFIYTRCRDARMCPLISAHYNRLQHELGARKVHLVEVSIDPTYDRPPVLARYARAFGADPRRWTLAVGDAQPTLDFAARFGISAFPDPDAGIIHTENTVEIGPDGRIRRMIADTAWQPAEIVADIDGERAGSNPFARFDWSEVGAGVLIFCAFAYLLFRLARATLAKPA